MLPLNDPQVESQIAAQPSVAVECNNLVVRALVAEQWVVLVVGVTRTSSGALIVEVQRMGHTRYSAYEVVEHYCRLRSSVVVFVAQLLPF
jgi:predicted RNA-binding protein with PIN domain